MLDPLGNLWGSERVLLDLLSTRIATLWDFVVYCPPNTPLQRAVTAAGIRVIPRFQRDLHKLGALRRVVATVRLLATCLWLRPRILYANQPGAAAYALVVGKIVRIPVLVHVRNPYDTPLVAKWLRRFPSAAVILCVSNYVRGLFEQEKQELSNKIYSLYDLYLSKRHDSDDSLHSRPATVICVARLEEQKGQEILLRALAVLHAGGTKCCAEFVGSPRAGSDYDVRLQLLAAKLDLVDSVRWMGEVADPGNLVSAANALVLPSRDEALGRVVLEAWDAGTIPIVWVGSGGPAEIVGSSGGGLLYDEQTPESLAESIRLALSFTSEERSAYIARGRAWLAANTDPDRYVEEMNSLFEGMVASHGLGATAGL